MKNKVLNFIYAIPTIAKTIFALLLFLVCASMVLYTIVNIFLHLKRWFIAL